VTFPIEGETQESLRDLAARLIDNGKAYAQAELTLVKLTVADKAAKVAPAAGFLVVAIILVQAAVTVLAAALGLFLGRWLGLPGGFAIAAFLVLLVAALLAWLALQRIKGITK